MIPFEDNKTCDFEIESNDRVLGETLLAFSNIKNIDKFRGKSE